MACGLKLGPLPWPRGRSNHISQNASRTLVAVTADLTPEYRSQDGSGTLGYHRFEDRSIILSLTTLVEVYTLSHSVLQAQACSLKLWPIPAETPLAFEAGLDPRSIRKTLKSILDNGSGLKFGQVTRLQPVSSYK